MDAEFTSGGEGRLKDLAKRGRSALLVGVYHTTKDKPSTEEHLEELERLADTYGLDTEKKLPCPLREFDPATFLGSGKVAEIAELIAQEKLDIAIFDDEISPQQQRNLEKAFKVPVIDRTELILGVFAQRAQSKEAKIQVQLAQFQYQLPRLKRMWTHLERQRTGGGSGGSGGGYLRGAGESQIEVDRRLIRSRIEKLRKDLKIVVKNREVQRTARMRSKIPTVAIIGYTNAGKSTLLNALTHAGVFVEDKLFATLETTTRKFTLPNHQEILLIDTVGFIRKLPHNLVEAFKSTLEEAVGADILLHLIDASSPNAVEQAEATYDVLKELKADKKPIITVLNKVDACQSRLDVERLRYKFPKVVEISALHKDGIEKLLDKMTKELSLLRKVVLLRIPQKDYSLVSKILREGKILASEYEENDILLQAEIPKSLESKLTEYLTTENDFVQESAHKRKA
jgi:GTPase